MYGNIFDIQRFSLNDGNGIRTTVFFKGCPLRCAWCSNPESQEAGLQRIFWRNKCIGCRRCQAVCPLGKGCELPGHIVCADNCTKCIENCPPRALASVGKRYSIEELLSILDEDRRFYYHSGGGVTFSGGEALMQAHFVREVTLALLTRGVHTAIETCGYATWDTAWHALEHINVILYDIKHLDSKLHKEQTNVENNLILNNLNHLADRGKEIILRVPLVGGFNDSVEHIEQVIELAIKLKIQEIDLLPYHSWGKPKHEGLSRTDFKLFNTPSDMKVKALQQRIISAGLSSITGG